MVRAKSPWIFLFSLLLLTLSLKLTFVYYHIRLSLGLEEPIHLFVVDAFYYNTSKSFEDNTVAVLFNARKSAPHLPIMCHSTDRSGKALSSHAKMVPLAIAPGQCALTTYVATCKSVPEPEELSMSVHTGLTEKISVTKADYERRQLVVCMSRIFYFEHWQLLLTSLEIYRHFGADLMVTYIESVISDIAAIMNAYEKEGFLKMKPGIRLFQPDGLDYDPNLQNEWGNMIPLFNSCLYEFKESAEFILFADWDDVLIPNNYRTYMEELVFQTSRMRPGFEQVWLKESASSFWHFREWNYYQKPNKNLIHKKQFNGYDGTHIFASFTKMLERHNLTEVFSQLPSVPVYYPAMISVTKADYERRQLVVCMSRIFYFEHWQLLFTSLEIYRYFGADLMVTYIESVISDIAAIMNAYEKEGFLKMKPGIRLFQPDGLDYDPNLQNEWGNMIPLFNSCLYEFKESAEFILFADWDDVLIPNNYRTYMEELVFQTSRMRPGFEQVWLKESASSFWHFREWNYYQKPNKNLIHKKQFNGYDGTHIFASFTKMLERHNLTEVFSQLPSVPVYYPAMVECFLHFEDKLKYHSLSICPTAALCEMPQLDVNCVNLRTKFKSTELLKGVHLHQRSVHELYESPNGCL
ncbi:hypothetical protein QR680_015234 [Steinernema hermaphroditum]|uniref:Glycosyltransferase family 92 protein n=1 Tax=Steinernema hermaphroditum TaxID=289476 RepID=A0AA39H8X3_9BILA|nr:hypothetical protein QR680_015234 [Steinernema hermaphroditum]